MVPATALETRDAIDEDLRPDQIAIDLETTENQSQGAPETPTHICRV